MLTANSNTINRIRQIRFHPNVVSKLNNGGIFKWRKLKIFTRDIRLTLGFNFNFIIVISERNVENRQLYQKMT